MTKLLFAAAFVAALAVVATAKPLSVNDNPTPVTCLECTVLGDLVEVLRKQGKTKDQIDTEVQAICARLPMPLKNQCQNAVSTQLDPLLSALDKTNGVVHTACQQIGKCAPATLGTSLPDCAVCEVEAAVLKKALKATTSEELVANLNKACDLLPVLLEEKCSKILQNKLKPLINELASKPTESSPEACQALNRCIASSNIFEGLVEKFVSQPADNPIECLACSVEAALLKNLLQTNTKAQIDANVTMLCNKLPDQLKQKCLDGITNLINPLIDQLVQNQNETPKQACQAIGKCAQSADEDLEQLVESATTVVRRCVGRGCPQLQDSPVDCIVCAVEAAILNKVLQNNTKADVDKKLADICARLPDQLRVKCNQAVQQKIDPIMDEIAKNPNENLKQVCQAVARCSASAFEELAEKIVSRPADNPIECLACSIEAALVKKALETNTKAQIDANLTMVCNKLPDQLKQKCLDGITNLIDPLIDQLVSNQNDTPKQACQAIGKCANSNLVEELVGQVISQPADNPIECLACSVEAALLKNLLQTSTKAQIDANITMLCNKLPDQLKQKCLDGITNLINPLIDQLVQNQNDTPKQACQAIGKCAASVDEDLEQLVEAITTVDGSCVGRNCPLQDSPIDCIACSVEAAILSKALQNNTKADVDKKLAELCAKLPDQLRVKCNQAIQQKIDPIMDEIAKNPNENPKQVCQAVGRCPASGLEQLVEKIVSRPTANPIDCIACSVEAALLKNALQTNTKAQIDANMTMLCQRLPEQLRQKCLDGINTQIDPLIDELVKNPNDAPKQACQVVGRCAAHSVDEDLEQLVKSATTVVGRCVGRGCPQLQDSPVDCIVCAVEAAILNKVLQNNTKADVDKKLADICARLPDQLRVKCNQAIQQKIDPIMDEIAKNPNENPKQVCQAVGRCPASVLEELVEKVTSSADNQLDCVVCGVEAALIAKALQTQTKAQIDANLTMLCQKLPQQIQQKCLDAITNKIDPIIAELQQNPNETPKQVCVAVNRCTADIDEQLEQLVQSAVSVRDSCHYPDCETSSESLDCIVCAVEAAILNKVLQNNTKADVDKKLAELCAKLPDQLRVRCNQAVTQKIDPIMDEIAKNPNENPKQVCQAVGRCPADNEEEDFEELAAVVAPTVVDPKPGVDCAMCGLESSILAKKLSQGTTKANIDKKLNKLCDKLPKSLRATCHNDVQTKIDPLMDGLLANQNDPKKACQIVGRCP